MPNKIINYYTDNYNEDRRHDDPFGIIQELRTKELVERYLGNAPMSILDIGGATGVYAFWLAGLGHTVSLLDITPRHTEAVEKLNAAQEHKLHKIFTGDAQDFDFPEKYDLILVHGPLYHILERERRVAMLKHVRQALRSGGVLLGFAINRYAGYFYSVRTGRILDEDYRKFVLEEIKTGVRKRAPGWYFHTPDELREEFEDAGLRVEAVKSVATQIWMLPEIEERIKEPDALDLCLRLAREMEDEAAIGQDLMCVGR